MPGRVRGAPAIVFPRSAGSRPVGRGAPTAAQGREAVVQQARSVPRQLEVRAPAELRVEYPACLPDAWQQQTVAHARRRRLCEEAEQAAPLVVDPSEGAGDEGSYAT